MNCTISASNVSVQYLPTCVNNIQYLTLAFIMVCYLAYEWNILRQFVLVFCVRKGAARRNSDRTAVISPSQLRK